MSRSASLVLSMLWTLATPFAARAQVIEIDPYGTATVYAEPTIFTADGAAPAAPRRAAKVVPRPPNHRAPVALASVEQEFGLQPGLLNAVIFRESRGRMEAVSSKGALGIMQLMPGTAAELGVDPRDRTQNIRGGAFYLKRQIDRFGSVPLGLAAYNAGPNAVLRFGGIPPYRETQAYVSAIMARWQPSVSPTVTFTNQSPSNPLLIEVSAP
jgi:soluble lytic murein transglycosylase-like protein